MKETIAQREKQGLTRMLFLACLAAVLYGLASPNLHWHPLCWILLIPLLSALDGAGPRHGFFIGWLFGTLIHLVLLFWVIGTVERFSNLGPGLSVLIWLLLCIYSGLSFGCMAALFCFLSRSLPVPGMVLFPVSYTAMEFLFPLLFPWHLGAGLYTIIPVIQISDIFSVYGLTALLALANYVLWDIFRFCRKKRAFPGYSIALLLTLIILVLLYGFRRMDALENYQEQAEKLAVGVVQPNISHEERMSPASHPGVWQRYEKLSGKAVREHAEILVWPESALFFPFQAGTDASTSSKTLVELVRSLDTPLLFGTWSVRSGGPRNTAFLLDRKGDFAGMYDKVHLLPFGEYIPFSDRFPEIRKWVHGAINLRPGRAMEPLCTGEACFGVLICYEAILDGMSRTFVNRGGKFLVNITNDVWFGDTNCPEQHLMLASFRAVENRVWLVRAANTGISAFVDPSGRILERVPLFTQGTRVCRIALLDVPSFYKTWGDWFPISCTAILILFTVWGFISRLRGRPGPNPLYS